MLEHDKEKFQKYLSLSIGTLTLHQLKSNHISGLKLRRNTEKERERERKPIKKSKYNKMKIGSNVAFMMLIRTQNDSKLMTSNGFYVILTRNIITA